MSDRVHCPECGETTEFVQFASGSEATTATSAEEVGTGLLELRSCDKCGIRIENILALEDRTVIW